VGLCASVVSLALKSSLLAWYRRNRRDLPWRRTADAYRIWVSEVMLQQTMVQAVVPYYQAFLERFPTVERLAAASEDGVLALWSGLGYYRRARNLHAGAKHLVRQGGQFPRTLEAALEVPGVGRYTAAAVLSIAYGVALPVVDGNGRRVFARLFALRGARGRSDRTFGVLAAQWLDPGSPGDWNQALMELGATVCTPRSPGCSHCPVRGHCRALAEGAVARLPERRPRRRPVKVAVAAAVIERGGRLLLVRRREGKLLGRMWEVPQTSLDGRGSPDLARELEERHGLRVAPGALLGQVQHAITYRRIQIEIRSARLLSGPPPDPARFRFVRRGELAGLPISSMTRKIVASTGAARGRTGDKRRLP